MTPALLTVPTLVRPAPKGRVSWVEFDDLPFRPVRSFWVHGFDALGGHAPKKVHEALFVVAGEFVVTLDRPGEERFRCFLSPSSPGILLPAGWWRTVEKTHRTGDTCAVCFCSGGYDADDQFYDRKEFEAWARATSAADADGSTRRASRHGDPSKPNPRPVPVAERL